MCLLWHSCYTRNNCCFYTLFSKWISGNPFSSANHNEPNISMGEICKSQMIFHRILSISPLVLSCFTSIEACQWNYDVSIRFKPVLRLFLLFSSHFCHFPCIELIGVHFSMFLMPFFVGFEFDCLFVSFTTYIRYILPF